MNVCENNQYEHYLWEKFRKELNGLFVEKFLSHFLFQFHVHPDIIIIGNRLSTYSESTANQTKIVMQEIFINKYVNYVYYTNNRFYLVYTYSRIISKPINLDKNNSMKMAQIKEFMDCVMIKFPYKNNN